MSTLVNMKARIARELRRSDLSVEISDAISTAIEAYKYERFFFNQSSVVDAPATEEETDNPWMTHAEHLIRSRAKLEVLVNVLRQPDDLQVKLYQAEVEAALRALHTDRAVWLSVTPGTLGAMKKRIASEIGRSGLDDDIANAINDAILAYQDERFFFNESRTFTFNTVNGQERYDKNDDAQFGNLLKFDYAVLYLNGMTVRLKQQKPVYFEEIITNAISWPSSYGWYGQQLVLYPTPNDAYTIRIGGVFKAPAPVDDLEPDNHWVTTAERLIRNRAKAELYAHVDDIRDPEKASAHMSLAGEAFDQLIDRTVRLTKVGPYHVEPYC